MSKETKIIRLSAADVKTESGQTRLDSESGDSRSSSAQTTNALGGCSAIMPETGFTFCGIKSIVDD
ncbi:MAG: hypothetical protein LBR31_02230 [Desulfovibrio sp.]|nr:hypothetical protein [Desulfovibrio sp.]